ncbi:MAG: hypothetical protein ACI3VK_07275 [Oscillospiraceae bacterium]
MSKNTDAIKRLARLINENWPEPGIKIHIDYDLEEVSGMQLMRSYTTRGEDKQIIVTIESSNVEQGAQICDAVRKEQAKINRRLARDGGSRLVYILQLFKFRE